MRGFLCKAVMKRFAEPLAWMQKNKKIIKKNQTNPERGTKR